jgi:transposase
MVAITEAHFRDVLARLPDHKARRVAELLPWNWTPAPATLAA